jgi:hypothetical protein
MGSSAHKPCILTQLPSLLLETHGHTRGDRQQLEGAQREDEQRVLSVSAPNTAWIRNPTAL